MCSSVSWQHLCFCPLPSWLRNAWLLLLCLLQLLVSAQKMWDCRRRLCPQGCCQLAAVLVCHALAHSACTVSFSLGQRLLLKIATSCGKNHNQNNDACLAVREQPKDSPSARYTGLSCEVLDCREWRNHP